MKHTSLHKLVLGSLIGALALAAPAYAAVSIDEQGWTVITPSEDSRIIYVSSSEGDDTNDGYSPDRPKKTLAHAQNFARHGRPDHLLLKRGDTFTLNTSGLNRWKNGRSVDEPIVISYYGDSGPRPIIEVDGYFVNHDGDNRNYQAFIGLDIYSPKSDPDHPDFAEKSSHAVFRFVGSGGNILIEDCRLRFGSLTGESYNGTYKNITLRRNIITDTWTANSTFGGGGDTPGGHTVGIYLSGLDGYLVEENFFDHCGWNEQIPHANANMFSHNVYIQYSNKAGGIFRGNISARSAAHGAHLRSAGIAERNLFVLNAISANFGGVRPPTDPNVMTFDNVFRENVMINGRLMDPKNTAYPRTQAVWGFIVAYVGEVDVIDNIVANRRDSGNNVAFGTVEAPASLNLVNNIVYQWQGGQDMNDPSWPNPEADLGSYYDEVVGTDATGEAATIEYLEWQRNRPIRTLPWEMTSYAAINHIREGFNKDPVEGYFEYPALAESVWADWPRDEEGYVGTGNWIGWLYTDGEWAYSYNFDEWMFLPAEAVTPGGAWAYIGRAATDTPSDGTWADWTPDENGYVNTGDWIGWLYVEGEWAYSYNIDQWMFLPGEAVAPGGAWAYLSR